MPAVGDGALDRRPQRHAEDVADGRNAPGFIVVAQDRRHGSRVAVPLQRPEIVPVRMDRVRQVALVARRLGQQPAPRHQLGGVELRTESRCPQRLEVVDRPPHRRPHLGQERPVAGEPEVLHDRKDQLAVAVVLGEPVRSGAIDDTRDVAVGRLVRRVPADELARFGVPPDAQQRRRHDRAVANPRPRVAPRARLQRRAVAVDQHLRRRRAHRVGMVLRHRRQVEADGAEARAPIIHRGLERRGPVDADEPLDDRRVGLTERDGEIDVLRHARRQLDIERERARRVPERVGDGGLRRQFVARQVRRDRAPLERRGAEPARRGERHHGARAVDPQITPIPLQLRNPPRPAQFAERLPRRVHLERAHGREDAGPQRTRRGALEPVAQVEDRAAVPPSGERRRPQRDLTDPPHRRRRGDPLFLERHRDVGVGPGDKPAVDNARRVRSRTCRDRPRPCLPRS